MSREATPTENVVAGEPGLLQEARDFAKASPRGPMGRVVSHLLALIERQGAELAASQARVTALEAEIARLRAALEWYAGDGSTYDGIDVGQRARQALSLSSTKDENDG